MKPRATLRILTATVALGVACVAPAATRVLVVAGIGGEPQYEERFAQWSDQVAKASATATGDAELVQRLSGKGARREQIQAALQKAAAELGAGDQFVMVLLGHGTYDGNEYRLNIHLTDQDIADLAAHFAVQTPAGLEADPSYWEAGEALYRFGDVERGIPSCAACHGPVGRGVPAAGYPAVQAQHAVYTVEQLNDYAAGIRYNKDANGRAMAGPNAEMMVTIAERLTPEDRRNLASYIQGMR